MATLAPSSRAVRKKPRQDSTLARIREAREPIRLDSRPPAMPPRQKKHIVKVKFRASWSAVQPKSAARGAFRMDQP